MIESFRHKGLRRLFEDDDASKLRPDLVRRIRILLAALDAAEGPDDLGRPSFGLHPLKGELKGVWSVWVNANWRITFQFSGQNVREVDLVDYH